MNCTEIRPLLHACADNELDPVRSLEVEQHLKSCAACAAAMKSIRSLSGAVRQNDLAFRAPASLRKDVRKAISISREEERPRGNPWLWKWIAAGATAFAVLTLFLRPLAGRDRLLDELVAGHVRSLQANHLTDVASSDQHTVKPWFNGKIDFAPDVKDFAGQGFPLVGGRLDYLDRHTVAALVYRRDKHLINVFVWPGAGTSRPTTRSYHGYSVIEQNVNGLHQVLVSDLNPAELNELAGMLTH